MRVWFGNDNNIAEEEKIDDLLASVNGEHEPIAKALRWLVRRGRADRAHFGGRLIRVEFAMYLLIAIYIGNRIIS